MTILTPPCEYAPVQPAQEALIKEAKQRQRRRWLVIGLAVTSALAGYLVAYGDSPSPQSASLLTRPLHFPSLAPGETCPATAGAFVKNSFFNGVALGSGPVRVLIANRGDLLRGRADLGTTDTRGWFALQTLWFSMPGYGGPFVIHGKRLGTPGPIEVRGSSLASGPLAVPSGPTDNSQDGYRSVPGSTWVNSAGCYAWQVDSQNFSEIIVVDASVGAPSR